MKADVRFVRRQRFSSGKSGSVLEDLSGLRLAEGRTIFLKRPEQGIRNEDR